MSNARGSNPRRTRGGAPRANGKNRSNGAGVPAPPMTTGVPVAQNPIGFVPFAKPAKDEFRTRILDLTRRYEPLCSEIPDGKRFRVRGEILSEKEDYFTVEFHCKIPGIINLEWAEYSSADLEFRFGTQIKLVELVLTAIRRSPERLGYELTYSTALLVKKEKSADWNRLMMPSKGYKALPREDRAQPAAKQASPPVQGKKSDSRSYYSNRDEEARLAMERDLLARRDREDRERRDHEDRARRQDDLAREKKRDALASHTRGSAPAMDVPDRRSWSEQVDEEIPHHYEPRDRGVSLQDPAGDRVAPLPSSYTGGSSSREERTAPAPTTVGEERRAPAPTIVGGSRGSPTPPAH